MTAIVDIGGAARYRPEVRSAYYERVYVHSSKEQVDHTSSMKVLQQKMQKTLTRRLLIFELSKSAASCISFA